MQDATNVYIIAGMMMLRPRKTPS